MFCLSARQLYLRPEESTLRSELLFHALQVIRQGLLIGRRDGHAVRAGADVGELLGRLTRWLRSPSAPESPGGIPKDGHLRLR